MTTGPSDCGEVWVPLMVDGGEGAEEELADIGKDGGTAGGDAVPGEEPVELAEGMMDAGGGLEVIGMKI